MSEGFHMNIKNMSEVIAKISTATTKIDQAALYAVGQVGLSLERRVKKNLNTVTHARGVGHITKGDGSYPNRVTGALSRSVFTDLRHEPGSYIASVFPTMVYSRSLEFGNPRWKSGVQYPYLKPSFDQERPGMTALFTKKFVERMHS